MNRLREKNVNLFELTINQNTWQYNLRTYENRKLHKNTREIIYALMKTVCNNTNIFVRLKTHSKYVLYAQLYKSTGEIIYGLMKTQLRLTRNSHLYKEHIK